MSKQRYEYVEGTSSKFWEVETDGKSVIVTYGRIGSGGQTKTKTHATAEAATKAAEKLIAQKVAKGYAKAAGGGGAPKPSSDEAGADGSRAGKKSPAKKAGKKTAFSKLALKRVIKAMERGSTKELSSALEKGLDPNALHPDWQVPLLHHALNQDAMAAAQLLIEAGASIEGADGYRNTALHVAVRREDAAGVVRLLLEAGADANARNEGDQTPMHDCQPDLMPILVDAGADVNAKDAEGRSPFACADVAQRAALLALGAEGFTGPGGRTLSPATTHDPKLSEIYRTECIGKGEDGSIWLGSYAGYYRFAPDGGVTRYVFADSFSPAGFARGKDGAVFFGTNWGLLRYQDDEWTMFDPATCELHDGHVVDVAADPEGRIYCLAYGNPHVSVFDGSSWTLLEPGVELPEDFEVEHVGFDADGNMLLGGHDGGMWRADGKWKELPLHDKALGTPSVYDFAVMDGALYVGCLNGIMRIDGKAVTHFEPSGVSLVTGLAAGDGVLWASGNYDGLMRLDGDDLVYYRKDEHGFLDGCVNGLVVADDGRLWMHDGRSVLVFDGAEIRTADGLSFEEARPEEAERRAKQQAKEAKKKAKEKKSKHVKG